MASDKVAIEGDEKNKIIEAKAIVDDYISAKTKSDDMISKLKNPQTRAKYELKARQNRGAFSEVIDSATSKFLEYAKQVDGWSSSALSAVKSWFSGEDNSMGVIPVVALAAPWVVKVGLVAAASVIIYAAATYASAKKKETELQEMILKDPSISVAEKNQLLGTVGGGSMLPALGLVVVGALLVFFVMRRKPA